MSEIGKHRIVEAASVLLTLDDMHYDNARRAAHTAISLYSSSPPAARQLRLRSPSEARETHPPALLLRLALAKSVCELMSSCDKRKGEIQNDHIKLIYYNPYSLP